MITRVRVVAPANPAPLPPPVPSPAPAICEPDPAPPIPPPATRQRTVAPAAPARDNPAVAALSARFKAGLWVVAAEAKLHRVRPSSGYAQFCQFFVRERDDNGKAIPLKAWEVQHQHKRLGIVGYDATLVAPDGETAVAMFHAANPDCVATVVRFTPMNVRSYRV